MDAFSTAAWLRACSQTVKLFTPHSLSEFFGIEPRHFHQPQPGGAIVFNGADNSSGEAYLLHGAFFWPGTAGGANSEQQIVRGLPRILPTSDFTTDPFAAALEPSLATAAFSGEAVAEPKLYGSTIRVYSHNGDLYCASDVAHDGGNPLVGAGIDNSRALGIDYGGQAAGILTRRYPKVDRLARLGYVAVFILQLPEFAPDESVDSADMVLVDVIDPDYCFVDRLEKERIAEDYSLTLVDLAARLSIAADTPLPFLKRCRALEHQAAQSGMPGYIVKAHLDDRTELFCKVETSSERERDREITSSDLTAVTEEITSQFGNAIWTDRPRFAEGLILEYLGTRHRSALWSVQAYLAAWQKARQIAGLP